MSRFNTGNPLDSDNLKDLSDNAKNADLFSNDVNNKSYKDRFGRNRKTIHGMEKEFDSDQVARADAFNDDQLDRGNRFDNFIASSGYHTIGEYAAGVVITEYNQTVIDDNGNLWRANTSVTLPYTLTGDGVPEDGRLLSVGDGQLRQELISDDSASSGSLMVGGSIVVVSCVEDLISLERGNIIPSGKVFKTRGYHRNMFSGGCDYVYLKGYLEHNGGTVISGDRGYFTPLDTSDMDISQWGAVPGTVIDDQLNMAILNMPAYSTLRFERKNSYTEYLMNMTPPKRTLPINIIGERGVKIKVKAGADIYKKNYSEHPQRAMINLNSSNSSIKNLTIDVNAYENPVTESGVVWYSNPNIYVDGLVAQADGVDGSLISNIEISGCTILNPSWQSISISGGMETEDSIYNYGDNFGIDGFKVINNNVSKGARSIINLTSGVRNGVVEGNTGINCYYDMIRAYKQVIGVDILRNKCLVDEGAFEFAKWQFDGNIKPWRLGIRVGHNSSVVGSCRDILVQDNIIDIKESLDIKTDQALIRISEGVEGCKVKYNKIKANTCMFGVYRERDIASELIGNDIQINVCNSAVRVSGSDGHIIENKIKIKEGTPFSISGKRVRIENNNSSCDDGLHFNLSSSSELCYIHSNKLNIDSNVTPFRDTGNLNSVHINEDVNIDVTDSGISIVIPKGYSTLKLTFTSSSLVSLTAKNGGEIVNLSHRSERRITGSDDVITSRGESGRINLNVSTSRPFFEVLVCSSGRSVIRSSALSATSSGNEIFSVTASALGSINSIEIEGAIKARARVSF